MGDCRRTPAVPTSSRHLAEHGGVAGDIAEGIQVPGIVTEPGQLEVQHAQHDLCRGHGMAQRDRPAGRDGARL